MIAPHGGNADYVLPEDLLYNIRYRLQGSSSAGEARQISLRILFERYGDILWVPGRHKYTVTNFISELHDLLPDPSFFSFSQNMLDELIGLLRKRGNSNATINRKMAALSKLLRKAYKMKDISSLPEFTREKEKAGRIRFLDTNEEQRIFDGIAGHSEAYYRLCIFLVDTGARLGEAIGLRWNDVSGSRVTFWVTKSGRSRSVPLTQRAKDVVDIPKQRRSGPFSDIDQQRFRTAWNRVKQDVGLGSDKDVVPHVLRHTCASRLVQGGVDIRRVQTWLGHQTLQMTMRYAHLASQDLDACVAVLEKMSQIRAAQDH
ncbi:tyrosine-type recombinase/integrase [Rhizobium sp. LjRoot30]|uniref:tyrosine-type recombinase/integrase n=1 Tax=Rhizobium sp. LjRoot30 TaxID=3342320 RepID=UPI003F4FAC19